MAAPAAATVASDSKWTISDPRWILKHDLKTALSPDDVQTIANANPQWKLAVTKQESGFSWTLKREQFSIFSATPVLKQADPTRFAYVTFHGSGAYEQCVKLMAMVGAGETVVPSGRKINLQTLSRHEKGFPYEPSVLDAIVRPVYGGRAAIGRGVISLLGFKQLNVANHAMNDMLSLLNKYLVEAPMPVTAKANAKTEAKLTPLSPTGKDVTVKDLTTAVEQMTIAPSTRAWVSNTSFCFTLQADQATTVRIWWKEKRYDFTVKTYSTEATGCITFLSLARTFLGDVSHKWIIDLHARSFHGKRMKPAIENALQGLGGGTLVLLDSPAVCRCCLQDGTVDALKGRKYHRPRTAADST